MNPLNPQPVVITGVGVLACNGLGREAFWDALEQGRSGIGYIDRFDTSEMPCHIGGQLWDFDPHDFLSKANVKRWHRVVHQSVAATRFAIDDAGFDPCPYAAERVAVGIGTSVGNLDEVYRDYMHVLETKGWSALERTGSSATSGHASTANVTALFGFRGPAITIGSGCATGLDMLTWGRHQVQAGLADAAVVGATEAPLEVLGFGGVCSLGILSQQNDEPDKAMKPFDKNSDGLVLSEAAVVLVLERADNARARGAHVFAEVAGSGSAAEGGNPLVLERDGDAVARAIRAALTDAGIDTQDVDCAHCHGASLTNYDRCETNGFKRALGEHAYRIPVTASKSMIGQAYACGGLLNVAGALLTLERGIVPPTINHTEPDPECDLDYVPGAARMNDARTALATALSFGGTHAATLLRSPN